MAHGETYEEFTEKFKPKLTTDDCYTPAPVYEAVKEWACARYGINPEDIVRPFWPGGDFETFDYPAGCVVLDNPPFSIQKKILEFYNAKGIKYFLFCDGRSALTNAGRTNIVVGGQIAYENGALVKTYFQTNLSENIIEYSPDLTKQLKEFLPPKKSVNKYSFPPELLHVAFLGKLERWGEPYTLRRDECVFASNLDGMKAIKEKLYGAGLLLGERAAIEKAAIEKAAIEKAHVIELSEREKQLIAELAK